MKLIRRALFLIMLTALAWQGTSHAKERSDESVLDTLVAQHPRLNLFVEKHEHEVRAGTYLQLADIVQ